MHIAVAGNIGSGKTTLTAKLARHYNWIAEFESVENNPYLEDFYRDMEKWSFHLQVHFLNSRFRQVQKISSSIRTVIQDRTIYEDAYIFAANLYRSQLINERDYVCYMDLFESIIKYVEPPDLLIYLKADVPKLVEQIQKRNRTYERAIRIDYLQNLNAHYEAWISHYKLGKLLIVDVNNMDFSQNVEDFSQIVNRIDVELNGLFS